MQLRYIKSEADLRGNIKGNQGGGTAACSVDIWLRLMGLHPVKKRNVLNKPIRCVSKVKPKEKDDEENQQYVELMRILPSEFVKRDVTARSATLIVRDPMGGADKKVEFMSSAQELDAFMSVQRSALYQDEEIDKIKWDESCVRLLREGGDATINLTPAKGFDWIYDSIWRRAEKIYRSKVICAQYGYPRVETTDIKSGIHIFCWATDDNPVMTPEAIERIFGSIDDPDELAMRRYGVFRQVSGRIYKSFDEKIHKISFDKVFDAALFRSYWHVRVIDYHPSKPWAVTWIAITPTHEWFVWNELWQNHDNRTTLELRDEIKRESLLEEDEEFNRVTLIDPLSTVKQTNTGFSVFDDLAMGDYGLRRMTPADTKNESARDRVKMRLRNSLIAGVPGNNLNKNGPAEPRYGQYLPTIWFLDNCKHHIEHFRSWRYIDWKQEHVKATKTVKKESQKFSDFCRNIEFASALNPVMWVPKHEHWEPSSLFQGRRVA